MTSDNPLLERVRKLLAKAEAAGRHARGSRGADGEGRGADGPVRHRPGPARRPAARDRPAGGPEDRHRQPVGPGPGASAVRAGVGDAVPVRHPAAQRAGHPDPHLRVRLRHRADRRAVHVAAGADVAGSGCDRRAGLDPQRAGMAAQLAARLHLRRGRPGPRGRAAGRRPGRRRARRMPGRVRSWCSPTGRRSSSTASTTPTRSPARPR